MWQKIKEILTLYKYWFLSIYKILFFIWKLIEGLVLLILLGPFITITWVRRFLDDYFDNITKGFLH